MSEPAVLRSQAGAVLTLTLNRPEKLKAFNVAMASALIAALGEAERDASVRAVVVCGMGRAFSAGQDLDEFLALKSAATGAPLSVGDHLRRSYNVVVTRIRALEKPVIASLNGIAAGVGLSIALSCDLRIASDDAVFTLGFSKIGLVPDGGGSLMLPLLVGLGRALELAWSSDRIDAREAYRIGLVNRVVPAADLATATAAYAERFAAMSPVAAALTKRAFNEAVLPQFAAWLEREADLQEEAASGPDLLEGVQAFAQKRAPAFVAR